VERALEAARSQESSTRAAALAHAAPSPALDPVFQLHQQAGNQVVQQFFRAGIIQAKLAISSPDDPEEQEADQMAHTVMRSHAGFPISSCSCAGGEEMCEECSQAHSSSSIQRSASHPAPPAHVPPTVGDVLRSPGNPLDAAARAFFEPRFGRDFSDVRVHTDSEAADSARSINANAYTLGNNIVFASGRYQANSDEGHRLIAHELAHVMQQSQRGITSVRRQYGSVIAPGNASGLAPTQTPAIENATAPAAASPPVIWGLDMSVKPPSRYLSVSIPGHSLTEVAIYLYGSPDSAAALSSANGGLAEHLGAGAVFRPTTDPLSAKAASDLSAAIQRGGMLRSEGLPTETPGKEQLVYRFSAVGQPFELTEVQYLGMLRGSAFWIRHEAGMLQDYASVYLEAQHDHVENSNSVIRAISDWKGDADLPDESVYTIPIDQAQQLIDWQKGLSVSVESKSEIATALIRLQALAEKVDFAKHAWHTYINATIEGAGSTAHALEVTRNVSFGIAAGLAGAVAAPVIFAAAGGGVLGGAAAIGGGALAGGATSGTLSFAGAAGGQGLSMAITPGKQNFDWGYVGHETWSGTKSGALQGGLGAAGALAAPGLSNVISNRLYGVGTQGLTAAGTRVVNVVTGATLGGSFGGVGSAIENFSALREGKITFTQYLISIGIGAGSGTLMGGAFSLVPISGLYKTGGNRFNPFGGTPYTPRWMLAGPFSPLQADWNPPAGFNALPIDQLPPLEPGYQWVRLNNVWEPISMNGTFRDPVDLSWYGPEAGRGNYNLLTEEGQLLGSQAMTRPRSAGGYQGRPGSTRTDFPITRGDFIEQGGTRTYIRGHNVDFHDTIDLPGTLDSNMDPANFTPEPDWWGLQPRNNLVQAIRARGGGYRQINFYGTNPRVTNNGTPIPDGVFFIETDAAGNAVDAWRIPFGPTAGPRTLAGINQFRIPVAQLPPTLQGPPPGLFTPVVGGAASELTDSPESR